jgi:hypothetical protein
MRPRDFGAEKTYSNTELKNPGSQPYNKWLAEFGRNGLMVKADYEAGNYAPYGFDAATIQSIEDGRRGGLTRAMELERELLEKEAEIARLRKIAEAAEAPKKAKAKQEVIEPQGYDQPNTNE